MLRKLFVIGFILSSIAFAQGKKGGGGGDSNGPPMSAAAPNKFDTICNALNLNKDQKKAVKTMLDDAAKEAAPLRDQMSKGRIAIADAIQAKKSDDEVTQGVNAYAALATQMSSLEINTFAKIYAGLDETQKANKSGVGMVFNLMKNLFATKNWNED
jgi:imidazolonepropionase-like amidohydrolase